MIINYTNIDPHIWGPHAWFTIDTILLTYPVNPTSDDITNYKNFILNLQYVLPCQSCRNHYTEYINNNPLTDEIMGNKVNLLKWMLNLHNKIRGNNIITFNDFINYYDSKINSNRTNTNILIVIIIICLLLLHYLLQKKIKL